MDRALGTQPSPSFSPPLNYLIPSSAKETFPSSRTTSLPDCFSFENADSPHTQIVYTCRLKMMSKTTTRYLFLSPPHVKNKARNAMDGQESPGRRDASLAGPNATLSVSVKAHTYHCPLQEIRELFYLKSSN